MEDSEAENLRLRISAMDLSSETFPIQQSLPTISEERVVFYDDDGLALDNIGFESVVVVDNLPIVEREMASKLENDIREIFSAVGVIKRDGFSMPVNPRTLETLGYCFLEFTTLQEAELAVENIGGYRYGSSKLSVTFYQDLHGHEPTTVEFEPCMYEKREDDSPSESEESESQIFDSEEEIGKEKHLTERKNNKECQQP